MFEDRQFRTARRWSNRELRRIAPLFDGHVVNVSAWEDKDKEGGRYGNYFTASASYSLTNYSGCRGFTNRPGERFLDLTGPFPEELHHSFDVAFNHTTLEHIFDVRLAFANLCRLTRDVAIVVVPFAQVQHETDTYKDYWRFTPTCLRMLFAENGLQVVYESESDRRHAGVYLMAIAARHPERWIGRLPASRPITTAGSWIGRSTWRTAVRSVRRVVRARIQAIRIAIGL